MGRVKSDAWEAELARRRKIEPPINPPATPEEWVRLWYGLIHTASIARDNRWSIRRVNAFARAQGYLDTFEDWEERNKRQGGVCDG